MKASDLILALQELINNHGDLEVIPSSLTTYEFPFMPEYCEEQRREDGPIEKCFVI